jgi:nucleotide-binding universal stress UspA family protein
VELETDLVVAHNPHDGILAGARRSGADLLVMGWKGFTDTSDRIFGEVADQVIRNAPCDLALLKVADTELPKRCLFPTSGGAHALLAAELLNVLAPAFDMTVTACHIVAPDASPEERAEAERWIDKTLSRMGRDVQVDRLLIEGKTVAGGIARASKDFDLVVLGAAREPLFRQVLFGEIPEKVARYSPASVLVVKQYEGRVRSLFKRVFG